MTSEFTTVLLLSAKLSKFIGVTLNNRSHLAGRIRRSLFIGATRMLAWSRKSASLKMTDGITQKTWMYCRRDNLVTPYPG